MGQTLISETIFTEFCKGIEYTCILVKKYGGSTFFRHPLQISFETASLHCTTGSKGSHKVLWFRILGKCGKRFIEGASLLDRLWQAVTYLYPYLTFQLAATPSPRSTRCQTNLGSSSRSTHIGCNIIWSPCCYQLNGKNFIQSRNG